MQAVWIGMSAETSEAFLRLFARSDKEREHVGERLSAFIRDI